MNLTFEQLMPILYADLKAGLTPALLGEPGIGKSSLIEDLGLKLRTKVFTLPVNQLADRADLTGVRMTQSKDGLWQQEAFPHSIIMDSIHYARTHKNETPILFLDEFNRASAEITSAILSFQTLRQIGGIKFPDNLRLVVAGNDKGNVTSLDTASISRFSVYRVMPDINTFFAVQRNLNPFIAEVLKKNPEDLMADEIVNQEADIDAEDDDNIEFEFEFDEDNFKQITRPRTITYLSNFMNAIGIDKSGSDKEKEILGTFIADGTLHATIAGHVGNTTFTKNLIDVLQEYYNESLLSADSNVAILDDIRPDITIINRLTNAQSTTEIDELIEELDKEVLLNTVVWLTENEKEINNVRSVTHFMDQAPYRIDDFDNKAIKNLIKILPSDSRVSRNAVDAMLNSQAPVIKRWEGMLKSIIEDD